MRHLKVRFPIATMLILSLAVAMQLWGSTTTVKQDAFNAVNTTHIAGLMENTVAVNLTCNGRICAAGTYEVEYNLGVIGTATAGTAILTLASHDGYVARSIASSAIVTTSTASYTQGRLALETGGTANMTGALSLGTTVGSANMYVNIYLKRIR